MVTQKPIRSTRGAIDVNQGGTIAGVVDCSGGGGDAFFDEKVQSDEHCGEPRQRDDARHAETEWTVNLFIEC